MSFGERTFASIDWKIMGIEDETTKAEAAAEAWADSLGYEEQGVFAAGKRCGLLWAPWMGDWFTSWSPRNSNSHAEGYWDHWVDLAIKILQDPLTKIVRPEAYEAAAAAKLHHFYDEANRKLTYAELMTRFNGEITGT